MQMISGSSQQALGASRSLGRQVARPFSGFRVSRTFARSSQHSSSPVNAHSSGTSTRSSRSRAPLLCRAADDRQPNVGKGAAELSSRFNPVYLAIFGVYAGLLLLKNPYIYAVLTILTVLPQNSNVTSLNNLVLIFYESGLFMNFAEAVTCVRLVTWLSMAFMVISFSLVYA